MDRESKNSDGRRDEEDDQATEQLDGEQRAPKEEKTVYGETMEPGCMGVGKDG